MPDSRPRHTRSPQHARRPRHARSPRRIAAAALATAAIALLGPVGPLAAPAVAAPGPAEAPEWWFDAWNVTSLWKAGADGRGITVAIVDTGVQASVPELRGKVLPGADLIGNGTDGRTDFDSEEFSHGTAMASLIVASQGYANIEGLAPAAKILPIAVPLRGVIGSGTPSPNATPTAIRYAADHGAKIISMSLGGFVYQGQDPQPCPQPLQDAVLYALRKGALVIAASGNSGQSGSPVEEPGVCLGVVSVGAVDSTLTVTPFSSRHAYLTVSAPGDNIPTLSRVPSRAFIGGGTSQATAITSAALADIWSEFPQASSKQVLSRLLSSVTDRGPKGPDNQYGLGVIDPQAAVAEAASVAAQPNEVFTGVEPLLALSQAKPTIPRVRHPAGIDGAPIGSLAVGSRASSIGLAFLVLVALCVLFVLLAAALLTAAIRRRPRTGAGYGY